MSEEPDEKRTWSRGTTILVGSLLVVSQVLTITSRVLDGESFFSPWVVFSAVLALFGAIFTAVALARTKRPR